MTPEESKDIIRKIDERFKKVAIPILIIILTLTAFMLGTQVCR